MTDDLFAQFKAVQREAWASFSPFAAFTTPPAASLVNYAGVSHGQEVLDVACGSGVVAVTAARRGARVRGLDLSPVLIEQARRNADFIGAQIEFIEGDAEALSYADATFDVVLSQFGHMFAPRPQVAIREMLRVLKPGGRIAFSTWPPELFMGQLFALTERYSRPAAGGAPPPQAWGDPKLVGELLGDAVTDLEFDRDEIYTPALSPHHYRASVEQTIAPVATVVATSAKDPQRLAAFRTELDALIEKWFHNTRVRQSFLMTRALKR